MALIASSIPGRLRIRHPALRNPKRLAELQQTVAQWPGVLAIESKAQTGSFLLHYAAQDPRCAHIETQLLRNVEAHLGLSAAPTATKVGPPSQPSVRSSSRVRVNRWAKRGMLLSLAISLLLAAAGNKRWHALTGGIFLHALGLHLWVHRRHLLK